MTQIAKYTISGISLLFLVILVITVSFRFVGTQKKELNMELPQAGKDSIKLNNIADENINQKGPGDPDTLFHAAATGNHSAVEEMIRRGDDVNERDKDGKTALFYAVTNKKDDLPIVLSLLRAGADVNARDLKDGSTPLLRSFEPGGWTESEIKALLNGGADVNLAEKNGWTPLMVATDWGYVPYLELLLGKGADVNSKKLDGKTALMIAAKGGKSGAVELLLKKGADSKAKDNMGKSALMLAEEYYRKYRNHINSSHKGHMIRIIELLRKEER